MTGRPARPRASSRRFCIGAQGPKGNQLSRLPEGVGQRGVRELGVRAVHAAAGPYCTELPRGHGAAAASGATEPGSAAPWCWAAGWRRDGRGHAAFAVPGSATSRCWASAWRTCRPLGRAHAALPRCAAALACSDVRAEQRDLPAQGDGPGVSARMPPQGAIAPCYRRATGQLWPAPTAEPGSATPGCRAMALRAGPTRFWLEGSIAAALAW